MNNHWGGSLEIHESTAAADDEKSRNMDWDRASISHHSNLDETQQSWLLGPSEKDKKKKKYVDFGCVVCSRTAVKWTVWTVVAAFVVIALPIIIAKSIPKHRHRPPPPDNYSRALSKALLFFDAQKSGRLPKGFNISWRGNSGLQDGSDKPEIKGGLVGGYYDAGDNTKFHFPMSFAMSMLSWSVIEYPHKYRAAGEYSHVRGLIRWGTDYLLRTFNSSADHIDKIFTQVGGSQNNSAVPDDHTCWQRPEDMDYPRKTLETSSGPDLAGEIAAALAAASVVFQDDPSYSRRLSRAAEAVFEFGRDFGRRSPYSRGDPYIEPYYNSTGYYDEYMWGAAWLYYATGKSNYSDLATNPGLSKHAKALYMSPELSVLSWDNKLPAAMLLLTRMRLFLSPGYPYEEMLKTYQNVTGLTMCSYLQQYNVFNWTKGGMIDLARGKPQNLQYIANAAFLSSLFADYLNGTGVPGWQCDNKFFRISTLKDFAASQINYILGENPQNMSYVVGYGSKYPRQVHHRGASIPKNSVKYSCKDGFQWLNSRKPNPNTIIGAMVGGPDRFDHFKDLRRNHSYTEPTLAGNAGLVAALVSLTSYGGVGVDRNTIFSAVPPLYPANPPPPPPWRP
ncbi:endoglucanase 12 [Andrographis paniculata]|uniref:endoglucanase 12 n=1 Tax=Andrographis paniculata TaxID=175694 RepID=UPI0021E7A0E1|nr:endoglucanase 12 [Andrographis paniculata]